MAQIRQFVMPDVGEGLLEADIVAWQVAVGDKVTDGQVIVEVETAKAVVELPCPFDGVVAELLAAEGDTVPVGSPIIRVAVEGEAPAAEAPAAPAEPAAAAAGSKAGDDNPGAGREAVLVGYGVRATSAHRRPRNKPAGPSSSPAPGRPASPAAAPAALPVRTPVPPVPPPSGSVLVLAKPPVRKLAKDLGVDLASLVPTGPNGVVTRDDVHAAAAGLTLATAPSAGGAAMVGDVSFAGGERRVPVKGVRKATAQAMVASAFTAPHVTEWVQVDVTRTVKLVAKLRALPEFAEVKVSPLLLVAKALLGAVRRNPDVNASWDEANQEIVYKEQVNLGIAAATPRGLIVPNIKDAGGLGLVGLARALGDLTATARAGKTQPAELSGGTITITNVGVFGIDGGTPILNPGEAAILAVGAIRDMPWVHKGKVKPRKVTTLALSFDHRLVDGELGSKVLADTASALEFPERLIAWG
ncbi:dihydrolipoamide acetyltransferase family protein [Yinghuangia soli]|uniref:Dihydrolipoamide acetyltransferase component of pyruvate dehydrogenase complex n=1 Tax=Yinghuangia soli TaxID=2908204 RepID=A0AA41PY08_9ACTN|nr:dihydrolipoamide acetyltransferase family protein [Yinghuangia soli]MCF2526542.1 2-oxo acid dehydrogenase subunit E2 [Yinghuangia soli]